MQNPLQIIVSLCAGIAGGVLAYRAGVPAGGMVGSMITVALVNVLIYPMPTMPAFVRVGGQIVIGTTLGLQVTKEAVRSLQEVILPAIMMTTALIVCGLLIGYLLHRYTGWDLITSMTSASPGGMTEMSLVCDALGGETAKTAVLQLFRMVSVVSIVPTLLRFLAARAQ